MIFSKSKPLSAATLSKTRVGDSAIPLKKSKLLAVWL